MQFGFTPKVGVDDLLIAYRLLLEDANIHESVRRHTHMGNARNIQIPRIPRGINRHYDKHGHKSKGTNNYSAR